MKINEKHIRQGPCRWDQHLIAVYANSSETPIAYAPSQDTADTLIEALFALAKERNDVIDAVVAQ